MDAFRDDVAEFALLLTRLKERTDRSYAALARRLDMHASTLHRYCVGEAVPPDFTGIERFAALCGASAEERVELHRQWILAHAARRRPRPSLPSRPARPSAPRRPPTPHDSTVTAATAAAARHNSPEPRTPEPTSRPAPCPGPTLPTPAPRPEATPPTPAPRPEATSLADSAPDATSPPAPRPRAGRPHAGRSRRRSMRSMALAAASLAVALAGLSASAAGRPPGGDEASATARATPGPSAPAAHRDGGPPSAANPPSASPSNPPPGDRKSPADARATPFPSSPAAHSGDRPPRDRTSAGTVSSPTPLTWTADSHIWRLDCDHDYVIAEPPRQVPPPPAPQDAAVWAASQHAVHGRTTNLRISVQGRGDAAVVLEALHVRVVNRIAPAAGRGSAYSMYEGCGAVLVPRHFSVDLDARRPLARSKPGNDPDGPAPALGFPYRVSLRDPEVLLLSARTETCTCDWYLELDWSSGGRTGTVRIDDHGRPFRTTSIEGLPRYWYRHPSGWIPMTTTYDGTETDD